jgi:hypothetical protein
VAGTGSDLTTQRELDLNDALREAAINAVGAAQATAAATARTLGGPAAQEEVSVGDADDGDDTVRRRARASQPASQPASQLV